MFRDRAIRAVSHEKAPFWTTLAICTIADGRMVPFTVIHESSAEKIGLDKFANLLDDFCVMVSESGYNTREDFYLWIRWFVAFMDVKRGNPFFLYIDGHDSHWAAEMHQFAFDNYLFIIFLRSNASITDQPNDNGANAKFKSCYDIEYAIWRDQYSIACPLSRGFMNKIISSAYTRMQNDRRLVSCIVKAFKITRCFPLE